MLSLVAAVAVAAAADDAGAPPISLFLKTLDTEKAHTVEAKVWTQWLAQQLRRWGFRVTTQDDLAELSSGTRQQQLLGCEDIDCGLDRNALTDADGSVSGIISGDDHYLVSLSVIDPKHSRSWARAVGDHAYSDPNDAFEELVPQLVEELRKGVAPGRIRERPVALHQVSGPPAASPRRCSSTGAGVALLLAALAVLLRPRRATSSSPSRSGPSAERSRAYDPEAPSRARPW